MIKRKRNIVLRDIHGSYYLINIKGNYLDEKCRIYEINEIGKYIWDNIDSIMNILGIVNRLSQEIEEDVDRNIIETDVRNFIGVLMKEGFLEVQDERN